MPWHDHGPVRREFSFHKVQVGVADAAGGDPQQDLPRARLGNRTIGQDQRAALGRSGGV
jgi:hypothetical protein